MSTAYTPGTTVRYPHQMPGNHHREWNCGQYTHYGTVLGVLPGDGGDDIVTIEFDCGHQADIPAADLQPVDD